MEDILETKPLREKIADRIRADIIKGVYKDGERLIEPKLAENLGISRTPVREALRQLENEGFIEIIPRKGAVVKRMTLDDVDNLYMIKANLEGLAARQAIKYISDNDIKEMERLNERFLLLAKRDEDVVEEYLKYNVDFHNVFIQLSKNDKLIEILEGLSKNFQRIKGMLISKSERALKAYNEHLEIIKAFQSRDPNKAEMKVRWHIENSWQYIKERMLSDGN
ncbi:transcriptional regulator, GntR family [Deferribacter desulfuricans SSM1]|uniref:Transcriptional regulator, GntR family n=1 Tax=Deferribacter desulfuricans (strain DSM 14783 / JCM 11476 / NBRC 101012 / SSM1) TaxID=639282 RepID=D3P8M6_DEFDS|nr:GntR family transcriptional regulator [Deferribacter desulfuricans]BAI81066.1 transcriptional regulator, GntR family [Deferribacter desulfuricans SSM1]